MNKKILSLAVAAAMAAPLAAQADVTIYGDINMDVLERQHPHGLRLLHLAGR